MKKCIADNLRETLDSLSENSISEIDEKLIEKNPDDAYEMYIANLADSVF